MWDVVFVLLNRCPRHRLTDVGDSDFEVVKLLQIWECPKTNFKPSCLRTKKTYLAKMGTTLIMKREKGIRQFGTAAGKMPPDIKEVAMFELANEPK